MMVSFRLGRGLAAFASIMLISSLALADPPSAPRSLTLARALTLARENNQVAAAARARIGEARGVLTTASVLLVDSPEVSFEIGPRRSPGAGTSLDLAAGLAQMLEIGGQRRRRRAVARAQLGTARANAEDVQRVVDLAVAQTFYAALAARLRLSVLEESEGLAERLREVALRRVAAGEGVPLEVATARIRLAEAQRRRVVASGASQSALLRLDALLGVRLGSELTLEGELPLAETSPPMLTLESGALERRPDVLAASLGVDAARAGVRLARSEAMPDLGVGVSYGREGDEDVVLGGLRVSLPLFQRNQGERQRSRAMLERRRAEAEATRREVVSEVSQALLAYEQARLAVALYDEQVLRAQQESVELLQRSFESGEIGIADVIVMQRELLEGREGYLAARRALASARAELLAAAHLPQTQALTFAP